MELLKQLDTLTLTCTDNSEGDIAPLIFAKQVETIQTQVDDALSKGRDLFAGWRVGARRWNLVPPTLLTGVNH